MGCIIYAFFSRKLKDFSKNIIDTLVFDLPEILGLGAWYTEENCTI